MDKKINNNKRINNFKYIINFLLRSTKNINIFVKSLGDHDPYASTSFAIIPH